MKPKSDVIVATGVAGRQGAIHTAGLDTIFVRIYMDALPGVPGVSKNQIFFLQI